MLSVKLSSQNSVVTEVWPNNNYECVGTINLGFMGKLIPGSCSI